MSEKSLQHNKNKQNDGFGTFCYIEIRFLLLEIRIYSQVEQTIWVKNNQKLKQWLFRSIAINLEQTSRFTHQPKNYYH